MLLYNNNRRIIVVVGCSSVGFSEDGMQDGGELHSTEFEHLCCDAIRPRRLAGFAPYQQLSHILLRERGVRRLLKGEGSQQFLTVSAVVMAVETFIKRIQVVGKI